MPYVEDRFKGRTTVKLESWIKGGTAKPEPAKSVPPPTKTNTNSKGKKSGGGLKTSLTVGNVRGQSAVKQPNSAELR